jgi:hypothetical protein
LTFIEHVATLIEFYHNTCTKLKLEQQFNKIYEYTRGETMSPVSTLISAGCDSSLDPVESIIIHRYSPACSLPTFIRCNTLVTLPSGLPACTEGGKPALEIFAVVPQTNNKGSLPLAVQASSISSPVTILELLG